MRISLQEAVKTLAVADKAAVLALLHEWRVPIGCTENHGSNCPIWHYLNRRSGSRRHHVTYNEVYLKAKIPGGRPVTVAGLPWAARDYIRAFANEDYGKVPFGLGIPAARVPEGAARA